MLECNAQLSSTKYNLEKNAYRTNDKHSAKNLNIEQINVLPPKSKI